MVQKIICIEKIIIKSNLEKKKYPKLNDYKLFHKQIKDVLNDAELGRCVACEKLEND